MGEGASPYKRSREGRITGWEPRVTLAPHPFLYAPDQIAQMFVVTEASVRSKWLHYDGRSSGIQPKDKMRAINIASSDSEPVWRIEEAEVVRWMRHKRIRLYQYKIKSDGTDD